MKREEGCESSVITMILLPLSYLVGLGNCAMTLPIETGLIKFLKLFLKMAVTSGISQLTGLHMCLIEFTWVVCC